MTVCLNLACSKPQNPDNALYCQSCGSSLLLQGRYRILRLIGQGGFGRTFLAADTIPATELTATELTATELTATQPSAAEPIATKFSATEPSATEPIATDTSLATSSASPIALQPSGPDRQAFSHTANCRSSQPFYCIIKQILPPSPSLDPSQQSERFQQEVRQLTQLGHHPQIPKLLGHFEDETGRYLVQEFIPGQNLEVVLAAQGVFSEAQIRKLLADLLPVLRFIHSQQVVHRDIKPANIIYPNQGKNKTNRYVLVDFGAAKSLSETLPVPTGTLIGSAGYTAPEQAMGKAAFASDLYSLGVTCIHLLTGLHPFDLYSISDDRWMWRQYLTQPISVELRRVLDTLLQRPISQRYRTATAVLQDLRLEVAPPLVEKMPLVQQQPRPGFTPLQGIAKWRCVQTLMGHQGGITALAISPDGKLIASGSTDKTIRLWSLQTGELLTVFTGRSFWSAQGHRDRITGLAFSPSGEVLLSSSADGTIKQWDIANGELFSNLQGGWGVSAIVLDPHDPMLVCGSEDGLIQLWDLEHEALIGNLAQLYQPITALAMDSAGYTAWSSHGKTIAQWDLRDDRLLMTLKGHAEAVTTIALSKDGCTLISGGADKLLKLWNLNIGQQQKVIAAHRDRIHCLAVHPNGDWFASGGEDGRVKLWDIWTGQPLVTLRHAWGVNAIVFSPSGELLVSGSADEMIYIWQKQ